MVSIAMSSLVRASPGGASLGCWVHRTDSSSSATPVTCTPRCNPMNWPWQRIASTAICTQYAWVLLVRSVWSTARAGCFQSEDPCEIIQNDVEVAARRARAPASATSSPAACLCRYRQRPGPSGSWKTRRRFGLKTKQPDADQHTNTSQINNNTP